MTATVEPPTAELLEALVAGKHHRPGGHGGWNPAKHPRDGHGRFISVGDHVTLSGGRTGRVTHVGTRGRLTVATKQGQVHVKAHNVTKPDASGRHRAPEPTAPKPKPAAPKPTPTASDTRGPTLRSGDPVPGLGVKPSRPGENRRQYHERLLAEHDDETPGIGTLPDGRTHAQRNRDVRAATQARAARQSAVYAHVDKSPDPAAAAHELSDADLSAAAVHAFSGRAGFDTHTVETQMALAEEMESRGMDLAKAQAAGDEATRQVGLPASAVLTAANSDPPGTVYEDGSVKGGQPIPGSPASLPAKSSGSGGGWDEGKHPRAGKGSSTGGQFVPVGAPKDAAGAKAQKDGKAAAAYKATQLASTAARAKLLKGMSDADLKKLTEYAYSSHQGDPKTVATRIAIAGEMARRGFDVKAHGALGGGIKARRASAALAASLDTRALAELNRASYDAARITRRKG